MALRIVRVTLSFLSEIFVVRVSLQPGFLYLDQSSGHFSKTPLLSGLRVFDMIFYVSGYLGPQKRLNFPEYFSYVPFLDLLEMIVCR